MRNRGADNSFREQGLCPSINLRGYAWTGTENSVDRCSILSRCLFTLYGRVGLYVAVIGGKMSVYELRTTDTKVYINTYRGTYYWTDVVGPYSGKTRV